MNKDELAYDGNSGLDHEKWVFHGISWYLMVFNGISWYLMVFNGI